MRSDLFQRITVSILLIHSAIGDYGFLSRRYARSLSYDRLVISPKRSAHEFDENSGKITCSYKPHTDVENSIALDDDTAPIDHKLVVRNLLTGTVIDSRSIRPGHGAKISFIVRRVQTSTTFGCEIYEDDRFVAQKQASVYVFTLSDISCNSNKDCWGYGRNVVCDSGHSHRCMCASKTARTAASAICIDVVPEESCDACDDADVECECTREPAIILKSVEYKHREPHSRVVTNDQIVIFNGTRDIDELYLTSHRDECKRCLRRFPNSLQNLQVGLFLVGVVLASTAVILMAIVIKKMWNHYRIPPDLLEASRDLERETIEREAEQMALRDKPPTYVEVMEYDLRISGYPPPDYEDLATVVRHHSERRRQQNGQRRSRRNQPILPINSLVTIQPAPVIRRPIFTTLHQSSSASSDAGRSAGAEPPTYDESRQRF